MREHTCCFRACFVVFACFEAAVCLVAVVLGACFGVAGDFAGPDGLGRADPLVAGFEAADLALFASAGDLEVDATFEGVTTFPKLEEAMMPDGAALKSGTNCYKAKEIN